MGHRTLEVCRERAPCHADFAKVETLGFGKAELYEVQLRLTGNLRATGRVGIANC